MSDFIVAHQSLAKPKVETIVLCTLGRGEYKELHCFMCCEKRKFVMLWQDDHVERYVCTGNGCEWRESIAKKEENE